MGLDPFGRRGLVPAQPEASPCSRPVDETTDREEDRLR